MSAPLRNDQEFDDVRLYAPPWARERPLPAVAQPQLISSPPVASAPLTSTEAVDDDPPQAAPEAKPLRMPKGVGGPNIEWAPRFPPRAEFEGDVAIRTLRRKLALEPNVVPMPPPPILRERHLPWIARLGFVFLTAAVIAFSLVLITAPEDNQSAPLKGDRIVAGTQAVASAKPAIQPPDEAVRLVVETSQVGTNEPLPLGVSLRGAAGDEIVLLTGLATGTRLTVGAPFGSKGWQISARDLGAVFAYAPQDYVGVMDAAIHLRSSGNALLDSQTVRMEWIAKQMPTAAKQIPSAAKQIPTAAPKPQSPVFRMDPDEIENLVARGQQYFRNGDIAAARLMFARAAEGGNASAAMAMGATFDPAVLHRMGVLGFAPDVEKARIWYQKAADLGASEAPRLVERLQAGKR